MSGAAERIEHPALAPGDGATAAAAALTDKQRVGVLLQAAGLLSLCEIAGWRPAVALGDARITADGLLRGVVVERGDLDGGSAAALAGLARRLFRTEGAIAGRGEAKRAVRALVARWDAMVGGGSADRAVNEILEAAKFLADEAFTLARGALSGNVRRDGTNVAWLAGRSSAAGELPAGSLDELVARGRYRAAVALAEQRRELAASERLLFARALFGDGKAAAALAALGGRRDPAAEIVRAKCQAQLGELGAARESVRRLEAAELTADDLLAGGDVVLRVLANSGESEAAREWVARAQRLARGARRAEAHLLGALAALDRSDGDAAESQLARARAIDAAGSGWLSDEVELQLALFRNDGPAALAVAARALGARRRRMPREAAGRLWSNVGSARSLAGNFRGAERAYAHASRILRRCDGPLALTLAGSNLADVRLRLGSLRGVDQVLADSAALNRGAGNVRGRAEDELLAARRDLVAGDLDGAVRRVERELARQQSEGSAWARERLATIAARALGWLERPLDARRFLELAGEGIADELEREELPFVLLLGGETERAAAAASASAWRVLAEALVAGEPPRAEAWDALERLEPFRRARFVADAELAAPGSVPRELRREAGELFLRLGAERMAALCRRRDTVEWRALARYFERPAGDRGAIEELLAAVGHAEAELVLRGGDGERHLAGQGGRALAAERAAAFGDGELVLRAAEIDEPLRALFALFRRDVVPPVDAAADGASPLVGESGALLVALDRLRRFAATELPVLVLGENGTGKELAASDIHRRSARARGPWVPVNCAGLSETLLLSELFGHVRGAFTGADQPRAGVFETARGGTVFLDEIGDLPLVAQGSLLRVLQEREIRRLGESLPRKVDARVVAATNRDLEEMVEQGRFRQDLYFRLKVATVTLPPLRERGRDVLLLAERFLEGIRRRGHDVRLSPDARRALEAHAWPGNVRELRNMLEAAAALAEGGQILPENLDLESSKPAPGEGDYHRLVESYRRRLIERALEASEGSLAGAARELGVTRQFLSQFVRKYGLRVR